MKYKFKLIKKLFQKQYANENSINTLNKQYKLKWNVKFRNKVCYTYENIKNIFNFFVETNII